MENFLSVKSIFSPGNTLSLNFVDETSYLKTFFATVIDLKNNDLLLKIREEWLAPLLKPGTEITISYQAHEGKKYLFGSYLIKQVIGDSSPVVLLKPWKVDFTSLRRYYRKEVDLSFYYFLNNNTFTGQAVNLSACGLYGYMEHDPELTVGKQFLLQLLLPTLILPLQLQGEIVRVEIGDHKLGVAVNFQFISESMREEILNYLLHIK